MGMKTAEINKDQDRRYASLLKDVSFWPIFIMGNPRSGTTLLYQLLDMTQCFNSVTAYHLIRYDEVLTNYVHQTTEGAKKQLGDFFHEIGIKDSRFDRVEITSDFPEEYGFILSSGYRLHLSPKNLPKFIELCKKIQFVSEPDRPLLLKNPWDYPNFRYVKEVFPASKFIFIHRNPINVMNSLLKAIRSLLRKKDPYHALLADWYNRLMEKPFQLYMARLLFSSHFDLGTRIVSQSIVRTTNYFLRNVRLLAETDYINIRYEDLCENPRSVISEILTFMGLSERSDVKYEAFIQMRQPSLLKEVERNKISILKRLEKYLAYYGYEGYKY